MKDTLRVQEIIEKLQSMLAYTTMPTALTDVREITIDGQTGRVQFGGSVDGMDVEQWAAQAATLEEDVEGYRMQLTDLRKELREANDKLADAGITS